jgi:hypothetical protein
MFKPGQYLLKGSHALEIVDKRSNNSGAGVGSEWVGASPELIYLFMGLLVKILKV